MIPQLDEDGPESRLIPGPSPGTLDYFITLDLGSESMAACFQHQDDSRPVTINLQAISHKLRPQSPGQDPIDLLRERDTNGISHRLRTRISLRERKQPSPLPERHAGLSFLNGYDDSLFEFFHLIGEALGSERLIPNPKLLFQTGIRAIIPKIAGPDGARVRYEPAELLQHLTVQILNNFVLNATELQDAARGRGQEDFDPRSALVTITVPNVYSLTHVRRLEDFVRQHIDVGAVETMYESDAVAHFMMGALPDDPDNVKEVKLRISKTLGSQHRGTDARNCLLLTIDIGKGTTDLSLFNYDFNHDARSFTYDVLGRTGRSHGGARLSYILAEYLNERIQRVLDAFETDSAIDPLLRKGIEERRRYMSLLSQPARASGRGSILRAAETLIESLKSAIDETYRININPLEKLIGELVEVLAQEINTSSAIGPLLGTQNPQLERLGQQMQSLRDALTAALRFPEVLPGGSDPLAPLKRIWGVLSRRTGTADEAYSQLRERLEGYVRENVEEPLTWLMEMAEAREPSKRSGQLFREAQNRIFVVVAGQASLFEPIRRMIKETVRGRLNIPSDPGGNLLFLPSRLAKLACCFGAQWYHRAALRCNNPEEIMGTYGFLRRAVPFRLVNLDMRIFNQKRESQPVDLANGHYWFIFQPRYLPPGEMSYEQLDSDAVAYIRTFSFNQGGEVTVRYRGWRERIEVAEGGNVFDVNYVATFGDVASEVEDIYFKTWPEAVPNES